MNKEEWKVIDDYPDYMVSSSGMIMSYKKPNPIILQNIFSKKGYPTVCLSNNGLIKRFYIHRLVAIAFIPNESNLPQVNHINGIKTDNCIDNLEWCTNSINHLHAFQIGLRKISDKNKSITKRRMSRRVINIVTNQIFDSLNEASQSIGISPSLLSQILRGNCKTQTNMKYYE